MAKIGLFDSGLGGLTVLKALKKFFPNAQYIYYGDLARLPYGNKTPSMIRRYLQEGLDFLAQFTPDLIVVACNSASTQVQETLWQNIPLYNVLEPIAEYAAKVTSNLNIGVIATRATVSQKAYTQKIRQKFPQICVVEQACPLFVPLIEEGWIQDPITDLIAYRYLTPIREQHCDTLILGCTHYPVIEHSIRKALSPLQVQILQPGMILGQIIKQEQPHLLKPYEKGCIEIFVSEEPSPTWASLVKIILEEDGIPPIKWNQDATKSTRN